MTLKATVGLMLVFNLSLACQAEGKAGNDYSQSTMEIVKSVRALKSVEGRAVGYAGTPGKFYELSLGLIETGTSNEYIRMTEEENAIVRAMGLLCLAITQGERAAGTIREHLSGRDTFECYPFGCIGRTITEGSFARSLIHDRNFLKHEYQSEPLLSHDALAGLDLEILAMDNSAGAHEEASGFLTDAIRLKEVTLEIETLQQLCPRLERYQLVKAVGRIRSYGDTEALLVRCLDNNKLSDKGRLAAASALTHHGSTGAIDAIKRNMQYLKKLGEGNLGTQLLEEVVTKREYAKSVEVVRATETWREMEKIKGTVLKVFSNAHPMAFEELQRGLTLAITFDHEDVRRTLVESLTNMSRRLDRFGQEWNTYSDVPYRLELMVKIYNDDGSGIGLKEAEATEILNNVRKYIDGQRTG